MNNVTRLIVGSVIILLIGGGAFAFSQWSGAEKTGPAQEQAEQDASGISEDDRAPFEEIGANYVSESEGTFELADSIDCAGDAYEWESPTLSCEEAVTQLREVGNTELALGRAFVELGADIASKYHMRTVVTYLDRMNTEYSHEVSAVFFDAEILEGMKTMNSYNKSLLEAALER